jgi:hypothetical protein
MDIKLKELIDMLNQHQDEDVTIDVDQPNPFQLVITLSK